MKTMSMLISILVLIIVALPAFADKLYELKDEASFAVSPENPSGAKGGGALSELMGGLKPSPSVTVQPGETAVLADFRGEGTIDSIWIGGEAVPEYILRIYWDGAETPAVECPLPAFFAHARPTNVNHYDKKYPTLDSAQVFISPGRGLNCYWTMPFRKGFRVTLENTSSRALVTYYIINGTLGKISKNAGWFHTQYRETMPVTPGQSITVLDVKGRGKYAGTALCLRSDPEKCRGCGCWCEGEVRFYIDGDRERPTVNFTGLEDYFGGSNAWEVEGSVYTTVSGLYSGLYCINHSDKPEDWFMAYRWHVKDPVKFQKDLRVTMFDLGWNREYIPLANDYITTAYYYLDTPEGQRPETVFDLNIPLSGTDNMIWNWWYYPQAISKGGDLYWTFTTREGYTGVARYDKDTGRTDKTYLKLFGCDDHNSAAIYISPEGRIVCAYAGGHNTDNTVHVRISQKPRDISRFKSDVTLRSSGLTCYSQLIYSGGRLNLFYRVNNKDWARRESPDCGETWSEEQILVTAPFQYYCRFTPTDRDGLIRINMYSNPDRPETDVRQGFLDAENALLFNAGMEPMGPARERPYTDFSVLIPKPEGLTQRLLDIAVTAPDRALILFAPFSMETGEYSYRIYDSGKVIDLTEGRRPIWFPKYQGGAAWLTGNKIVLSRSDGDTDFIELWSLKKGVAALEKTVWSEPVGTGFLRNARPVCDVRGKAFLWHRGAYPDSDYTDFDTEAKIYYDK
ncbi:MAG: DUF2961 domain-containing protein [Abditibacteriota bacterium]|nr:DUF2961 domain-containing protein [Abditibacteriota bacterium]